MLLSVRREAASAVQATLNGIGPVQNDCEPFARDFAVLLSCSDCSTLRLSVHTGKSTPSLCLIMKLSAVLAPVALFGLSMALPNPTPMAAEMSIEPRAATCLPNYQGTNLYISSTAKKTRWTVKALKEGSAIKVKKGAKDYWRIERTGFPQEDFIIK